MKALFYAVAAVGLIVLIAGFVLKFVIHHSHGLETLAAGLVLLVIGLACAIFLKPKAATAA